MTMTLTRYTWPTPFDPKRPDETDVFGVDLSRRMEVGETISSASVTCCLHGDATETNIPSMVVGGATISGASVSHRISGGQDGHLYSLVFDVQTSAGRTLQFVRDFLVARRWDDA